MQDMKCYVLYGPKDIRPETKPVPQVTENDILIRVATVGICGSDIHYYLNGAIGDFILRDPFVLGHEFAGTVEAVGEGVTRFTVGDRVTVEPSVACGACAACRSGRYNLCSNMRTFGSASSYPHVDGGMAQYVLAPERNCYRLPEALTFTVGALIEPMAVAAHAVTRAGNVIGKTVLVAGGGTVGQTLLTFLRSTGAARIVVNDLSAFRREFALLHGADSAFDPVEPHFAAKIKEFAPEGFDVLFEASGTPAALTQAMDMAARGATIVQVGSLPSETRMPGHLITSKELQIVGCFRYAHLFDPVIDLISRGTLTVDHLVTHAFDFAELPGAFDVAINGDRAVKVQMNLS